MPSDVKIRLINLTKLSLLTIIGISLFVTIIILIDRQRKKDYSDQTGFKNFRYYNLAWVIILIVVSVIIYALLLGVNI